MNPTIPPADSSPHHAMPPLTPSRARAARRERLSADIASRLKRVCGHLPDGEFAALVGEIADVTLRYEERELGAMPENAELRRPGD